MAINPRGGGNEIRSRMAGVALAMPLAAVGAVMITMLYVQDVLGDRVPTPGTRT